VDELDPAPRKKNAMSDAKKKDLEEYGIYFHLKKTFAPQSTSPFQLKFHAGPYADLSP